MLHPSPSGNIHIYYNFFFYISAYHGHLTSLIDISPYKFRKLTGQKEWVHVVCKHYLLPLLNLLNNKGQLFVLMWLIIP